MKKILPIKISEVTCHPATAALFGIMNKLEIGKEWIYSNFIMIESFVLQQEQYQRHLDLVIDPSYDFSENCPYISKSEIKVDLLKRVTEKDIITILKSVIDADNYIYMIVDESIFLHKRNPFLHELFIYGYDDEEKKFYVGDFTFKGKYSLDKVQYREMEEAYTKAEEKLDYGGTLTMWRVNKNAKYCFDITLVRKCMEEYLKGESYSQRFVKCFYQAPENICGIFVYDFLILHMYEEKNHMLKCLHNLYDHKKLMLERLHFMEKHNYIDEDVVMEYDTVKKKSGMACGLYMKFQIVKENVYLDKVVDLLLQIKEGEKNIFIKIINKLL